VSGDPHAAPESLELQLLRELRRSVARVEADVSVIREAVLGLGERVGRLERGRLTDSWVPDHGDGGR
jgi:hypothetical protein